MTDSPPGAAGAPLAQPLHEYLRGHAQDNPEGVACIWYGHTITWAELDRTSDAFAARLQALGVKKGDPVALFLNNCPQYLMAHFGIQKMGAIVCPCGPLNKEHELQYQLGDLQARVIVAAESLLPVVDKVRAQTALQHVFVVRYAELLPEAPAIDVPAELLALRAAAAPAPAGCEDFLATVRAGGSPAPVQIAMDDVALMTYTSGTTGLPKGAMLTYGNALFKTAAAAQCNGVRSDDVLLSVAPLYHIAGMVMGVNVPVFTGATSVLMYRFDPLGVAQALERHRVGWWYSIAPMNAALMQVPGLRERDLTALRMNPVTSFGITLTEALAQQWKQFAPNCASFEASYGLSETHTVDTSMPHDAIRWGTQGKAVPGNEIRIIDPETGATLPPGEMGEITVRGPGNFKGYWNKPEATAEAIPDGWFRTGDLATMDSEGYFTIVDRKKDMILRGGMNVYPREVEECIYEHPDVLEVAVVGIPDELYGEQVGAAVALREGSTATPQDIIDFAKERIAAYKYPRTVWVVPELPKGPTGKILRREVHAPAE